MPEFVFMLTRDDQTITDARETLSQLDGLELRHVGFKDVGVPPDELAKLTQQIRDRGCSVHLEVVSETEEATLASARMANELGPEYLLGGTLIEPVQKVINGNGVKFFPYIGEVVGHPCLLRGSIERICDDARKAESLGVDGINLLAYRYDGDVPALVEAVCKAISLPVLCAGSIDSPEQIRLLGELGVWGFTVGTAVLDRKIVPGASLVEQIEAVLAATA